MRLKDEREKEGRSSKQMVTLRVNGDSYEVLIEPKKTLLEVLREDLGLTGTEAVCGLGACGACTVLLDHKPVLSCLTLAVACQEKEIVTIEGLRYHLFDIVYAFLHKNSMHFYSPYLFFLHYSLPKTWI
jgi:carbon-monoxide dehydrogenase small subunit